MAYRNHDAQRGAQYPQYPDTARYPVGGSTTADNSGYLGPQMRGGYETLGNIRGNEDYHGAPLGSDRLEQDLHAPMQDMADVPRGYGGYAGGNVRANQGYAPRSGFVGGPGSYGAGRMGGDTGGYSGDTRNASYGPYGRRRYPQLPEHRPQHEHAGGLQDYYDRGFGARGPGYGTGGGYPVRSDYGYSGYDSERAGYRDDRNASRFYGPGQPERQAEGAYGAGYGYGGRHFDPDYHQWRSEQMRGLDDDYRAWRGERYNNFSTDFDTWRKNRQSAGSSEDSAKAKQGR